MAYNEILSDFDRREKSLSRAKRTIFKIETFVGMTNRLDCHVVSLLAMTLNVDSKKYQHESSNSH
jgi:hypothetical protein